MASGFFFGPNFTKEFDYQMLLLLEQKYIANSRTR